MSDAVLPTESAVMPNAAATAAPAGERGLRLWPGGTIVALQAAAILGPKLLGLEPFQLFMGMFFGPMVGALLVVVWWTFFSRVRWRDRFLVLAAFAAAAGAARLLCDTSMRFPLVMYPLPIATSAWVLWLLATPFLAWPARRLGLLAVILFVWVGATLVRMDGIDGSMAAEFAWRWAPTAEDKFLAEQRDRPADAPPAGDYVEQRDGDWVAFRGPNRDGRVEGVRIATDWAQRPPKEAVWRHRVGPGWGSFAVVGSRLYTQEQRARAEAVVCYDADGGKEVWVYKDEDTRFSETVSGAGPRGTPTFHDGSVYALGANGRLNCLGAATGQLLWSKDAKQDTGASLPVWGFCSSPLVAGGVVSVITGGPDGKSAIGYDAATGEPRWTAGEGRFSYASPQFARLGGVDQVLIATDAGLFAVDPERGHALWQHGWQTEKEQARIIQPLVLDGTDLLLNSGPGYGERRLHVARAGASWAEPKEEWTSKALKSFFNDRVVYGGNVYGFDGNIFACISAEDGRERWRGGRYGGGQVLLLADQGLLLVLSEKGQAVLLKANPDKLEELGRFQALTGKTWNHPVVAHGKLFVRNGEEAACYDLHAE